MRWILSLKKPMKYREFATALAAKECGKTNNNKKHFNFDPKKSLRKTKEIPRIRHRSVCKFPTKMCGKITNKKSEQSP